MSKQNKHPEPQQRHVDPEDRPASATGPHEPDIQNGKNKMKRNNSPQQKGPEAELDWNKNEEEPVEERSQDSSASL